MATANLSIVIRVDAKAEPIVAVVEKAKCMAELVPFWRRRKAKRLLVEMGELTKQVVEIIGKQDEKEDAGR